MNDLKEKISQMLRREGDEIIDETEDCYKSSPDSSGVGRGLTAPATKRSTYFSFGFPHNDTIIDGVHTTEPTPAFLGVKIVGAYPMLKSKFDELQGRPNDSDCEDCNGFAVTYEDGYKSWSPANAFNKAYRRIDGLTFGLAIEALKQGRRVARQGWNGKGMWLALDREPTTKHADFYKNFGIKFVTMEVCPTICMKTADDKIVVGWLASQTDMLAEDWEIVE